MNYTTSEIGFIRCDKQALVDEFLDWQSKIFLPLGWNLHVAGGVGFDEGFTEISTQATAPITKHLFMEAGHGWAAYFDNGPHGTDAAAVLPQLALRTKSVAVRFVCAEKLPDERWPSFLKGSSRCPARIFEYFNESDDAGRVIFSVNDGGRWKHSQYGDPLSDEGKLIGIVDKGNPFTSEKLERLLSSLGILAFDEGWYGDAWALVSKER
jgi:hypothetical protein